MRGFLFGVVLLLMGLTVAGLAWQRAEALAAENALLRRHAAARERVKNWGKASAKVDKEAVAFAAYNWGTPPSLLTAIRLAENGSPQYEMGHKGKSVFIASNTPLEFWQYCEAARTVNKALWHWALADKRRARDAIKALGKAYTSENRAAQWSRNIERLEYESRLGD